MTGIPIPRDASQQVKVGLPFGLLDEAQPGDLAFLMTKREHRARGNHLKRNKIIHASGKVRIDNVDQFGIFNVDLKRYTHKMRVMKRITRTDEKLNYSYI